MCGHQALDHNRPSNTAPILPCSVRTNIYRYHRTYKKRDTQTPPTTTAASQHKDAISRNSM
ncbi:MAG: hypothetical protein RLY31_1826 [Bacteroidota bacterium]|jgi:hypothetical protein